jgi:hypothetical protein
VGGCAQGAVTSLHTSSKQGEVSDMGQL